MGGSGRVKLFLEKGKIWRKFRLLFDKKRIEKRLIFNELCILKKMVGIFDLKLDGSGKLWMEFPISK